MVNRRGFFSALAAIVAAPFVPAHVVTLAPKFVDITQPWNTNRVYARVSA